MSTGLLLDGVFASEAIDSSGEILDIKGMDISDFDEGKGCANYEHQGHDNENNQGQEIVGKVLYAKKIFSASDCTNDREKLFWNKVKIPFLYGVCRLYDGAGHEGAKALAAIIRDSHANNEPLIVGFSIEGSTLEKDPKTNRLKTTIARRVALTLRPCNKTAVAGLLADPNAPEGYEKAPVSPDLLAMVPVTKTKKSDHVDPRFTRLGGSEAIYGVEISKAMAAGNYNAAPSTLTGGAALQVEDPSLRERVLKAGAMAAYRDWDRVTPFRKFLKARLPEASDDFIDHFNDLIERHIFRVKKAEEVLSELQKAGKKPKKIAEPPPSHLTIQSKPVPSAPEKAKLSFNDGLLTTKGGIFRVSTPSDPHPHLVEATKKHPKEIAQAFKDELAERRPHHQKAMRNWFLVNDRFSRGDVNPGVVSHAVAFALMSPGTPVPMQEFMYGHFVDQLHSQGLQSPSASKWDDTVRGWLARNRTGMPQHSSSHWSRQYHDPTQGAFTSIQHELMTAAGVPQGFAKPNKFVEYFGDYIKNHHDDIVQTIQQAKGDAHKVARRLTDVRGIAPKLSRYLLGMMGAGNIIVPDTHLVRHLFGAKPGSDTEAQEHLKRSLLSSSHPHDLLEGLDKHYFQNHDAVKAVLSDPTIGPYFKGREQQAIFPAFWWHWIAIPGHERRMGIPNPYATNAETDHAPFWDAVAPMLKKGEDSEYDPDLHWRTAAQHHRWLENYGPVRALGLYYRYLVPQLLANEAKKGEHLLRRFEEFQIDFMDILRKADKPTSPPTNPAPKEGPNADIDKDIRAATQTGTKPIDWNGRRVLPGLGRGRPVPGNRSGQLYHVIESGPTHHVLLREGWDPERMELDDLVRVPRNVTNVSIVRPPIDLHPNTKVSLKEHGVGQFNQHPEAKAMAEGFDFASPSLGYPTHAGEGSRYEYSRWTKAPNGRRVFVKGDPTWNVGGIPEARQEAIFSHMAHTFFGLGEHVPPVAIARHPRTGVEHAIIPYVPGTNGYQVDKDEALQSAISHQHEAKGTLDKLAMMDMVMGNMDRHHGNYLVTPEGHINLIDHNITLGEPDTMSGMHALPSYLPQWGQPHPEAVKWLNGLDASEFEDQLRSLEVPDERIRFAADRLRAIQGQLRLRPDSTRIDAYHLPMRELDAKEEARQHGVEWRP